MNLFIPTFGFGRAGGFRTLAKLANYLSHWGHQVTFVTPEGTAPPYYPLDGKVKVVWVDRYGRNSKLDCPEEAIKMPQFMKLIGLLLYLRKNSTADRQILASFHLTAFLVLLGGQGKKYYYIQAYEPQFYEPCNYSFKRCLFMFLAWISYFLPLKRIINAEIYRAYKNIRANDVVMPGLDLDVFFPRSFMRSPDGNLIVGCIGRVETWKGGSVVAEAVNRLRHDGFNVDLRVAFHELNGVQHCLHQPKNDNELASFYRSLDVMVTPGLIQLGAVHYPVIEAMACRIPVVTTKYYPAKKTNSYIVEPGSVDDVVNALKSILTNQIEAERKALNALDEIKQFEWELIARKMESILLKE